MSWFEPVDPIQQKIERNKARELKKSSWWRQQIGAGVCYHCGHKFGKDELNMDHLIPIVRGGKSNKQNCVVSCKACNAAKGNLTRAEIALKELTT